MNGFLLIDEWFLNGFKWYLIIYIIILVIVALLNLKIDKKKGAFAKPRKRLTVLQCFIHTACSVAFKVQ